MAQHALEQVIPCIVMALPDPEGPNTALQIKKPGF
jgi:hypothetical protein